MTTRYMISDSSYWSDGLHVQRQFVCVRYVAILFDNAALLGIIWMFVDLCGGQLFWIFVHINCGSRDERN